MSVLVLSILILLLIASNLLTFILYRRNKRPQDETLYASKASNPATIAINTLAGINTLDGKINALERELEGIMAHSRQLNETKW